MSLSENERDRQLTTSNNNIFYKKKHIKIKYQLQYLHRILSIQVLDDAEH